MKTSIYDDALRDCGLTSAQMTILTALAHTGGVQPGALCDALKLDKSTLSRNVDRMARNGGICKQAEAEARSHKIELTVQGRKRFALAIPHWRHAQAQAETEFGNGGMEAMVRISKRIRGF